MSVSLPITDLDYFKGICSNPLIHTETDQMHAETLKYMYVINTKGETCNGSIGLVLQNPLT